MRRLALLLALVAAPAGAVTPVATEDALDPARAAFAGRSLAACLRDHPEAAVTGAREIGAIALIAHLRRPDGSVLLCNWHSARGATVLPVRPEEGATAWTGPRIFTLDRRCPAAMPVGARDGVPPVGWLSPSDCR
ncbi:hypothetical protein [Muricoccus radiodurans]|uniref:hypothetical protein n=1 Tax=Muricoccus radiodurans TaxID=2231721 RepID=UPI003CF70565